MRTKEARAPGSRNSTEIVSRLRVKWLVVAPTPDSTAFFEYGPARMRKGPRSLAAARTAGVVNGRPGAREAASVRPAMKDRGAWRRWARAAAVSDWSR